MPQLTKKKAFSPTQQHMIIFLPCYFTHALQQHTYIHTAVTWKQTKKTKNKKKYSTLQKKKE